MQILLNNAYEAWKSAIYYHDRIEKGFTTLEFQKVLYPLFIIPSNSF